MSEIHDAARVWSNRPGWLKFISAGILNTVFGYVVYALAIVAGLHFKYALVLATILGVLFNYHSFKNLVFEQKSSRYSLIKFVLAYVLLYIINALLLSFLVYKMSFSPFFGQIFCIPCGVVVNWLLMKYWVYTNEK